MSNSRKVMRVYRVAQVLTKYLAGKKAQWIDGGGGMHGGLLYLIPPYRIRPLMNACAAALKKGKR